jgi:2-dehydro-3-deoxyphosphooctonate aldolase (KDO 8-P synthase)
MESSTRTVRVGDITIGGGSPLALIAGPCVIESAESSLLAARSLQQICDRVGIPFIFKTSFDKANRTSAESIFQVPAFLCRQTSLLSEVAGTGLPINVKKGQFLAPWDVKGIIGKVRSGDNLVITERGTTFGYNNLIVDFRSFPVIRQLGVPVVYDATHSLQLPGGLGDSSGGMRQYIPHLCRAAVACGVDALFMEVHPDPDSAPCDGPNMWPLGDLEDLLRVLLAIDKTIREGFAK